MSRLYNPAIFAYKNMEKEMPKEEPVKKSSGLLAPSSMNRMDTKEDLSQPIIRVQKHFNSIKDRRKNINGN
tara:strand:+ start:1618 stop:1830 length:213 start_codon:yes stop_codon:yes gene_type:complete